MSRKDQILDVLIKRFNTSGFTSDFTMSELAECANIGKSTIYEYFSNKDEILKAAVFKFMDGSIDRVRISDDITKLSFEEGFKTQLKALLEVATESRHLLETLTPGFAMKLPESMKEDMKSKIEDVRALMQKRFGEFFVQGINEGVIKFANPNKVFVVTSLVIGSIMAYSDTQNRFGLEEAVEEVYQGVIKLLS